MATGYVRVSSGLIVNGATIQDSHFNNEFNAIQSFADASTGHNHDGTTGGGAAIPLGGSAVSGTLPITKGGTNATTASAARTALGVAIGSDVQAYSAELAAYAAFASTGIIARTAAATLAARTITGTANRITLTNGSGVSGNPTIDIASNYVGQNTITTLGTITTGTWTGTSIAVANGGTGATTAANARTNLSAAGLAQTEYLAGYLAYPEAKDYRIALNLPYGGTITELTTRSEAGTATLTGKINTVALGGTANSVSTAEQTQAHASSNAFVTGDDIVLTLSSLSSCTGISFLIKYTRNLVV